LLEQGLQGGASQEGASRGGVLRGGVAIGGLMNDDDRAGRGRVQHVEEAVPALGAVKQVCVVSAAGGLRWPVRGAGVICRSERSVVWPAMHRALHLALPPDAMVIRCSPLVACGGFPQAPRWSQTPSLCIRFRDSAADAHGIPY